MKSMPLFNHRMTEHLAMALGATEEQAIEIREKIREKFGYELLTNELADRIAEFVKLEVGLLL